MGIEAHRTPITQAPDLRYNCQGNGQPKYREHPCGFTRILT